MDVRAILATEENPKITFGSHVQINVTLTVTDNKKRKDTKTVTMDIARAVVLACYGSSYDEQGVV
jgi:PKD repeat protein